MGLIVVVLASAAILGVAYVTYGRVLARLLQLNAKTPTPAVELRDDIDYEPVASSSLFPQHFSAIAAAGPIVGPILAGLAFGWLPALIWILVGSIFIGGVHDFTSLVASIRHKARSIAEVVRDHMSPLSYLLFLSFIWIALVYIIVAFTDITASAFVGAATPENGGVGGGAIATSSLLYLILPILMGLLLRYAKIPLGPLTAVFIVLVGVAIWCGKYIPLDVSTMVSADRNEAVEKTLGTRIASDAQKKNVALTTEEVDQKVDQKLREIKARKIWDVALLIYCLVAGVVPVWMLLQPRGHLGGYFLYFALGAGALGLLFGPLFGSIELRYPAFKGWSTFNEKGEVTSTLFPILFITVACGACSGFHSLIASGTTSKQLKTETDAKVVGYGAMLLEGMVAVVSLCCVMMFAVDAPQLVGKTPNEIYAAGVQQFVDVSLGWIPGVTGLGTREGIASFGFAFALMAFTTFVYDTLDVCTRLGRFIIQELSGLRNWFGRFLGTALTAGVPLYFLLNHPSDAPKPVWNVFWQLFGASNQLLAALTLLGITVWLWKTRRAMWVWPVVGLPAVWMYTMSTWALVSMTRADLWTKENALIDPRTNPVPYIGIVLLALALVMLIEAIRVLWGSRTSTPPATVGVALAES
jgi:carbon starvation protein